MRFLLPSMAAGLYQNLDKLILFISLLVMGTISASDGDVYWLRWFVLITTAVICLEWPMGFKSYKVFFVYASIQMLTFSFYRTVTEGADIFQIISIRMLTAQAFSIFLLLALFFAKRGQRYRDTIFTFFCVYSLMQTVSLFLDQTVLPVQNFYDHIGLLGNRSMGASFLAVTVFFFIRFRAAMLCFFIVGGMVLTICISKSSISFIALIAGLMFFFSKWRGLLIALIPLAVAGPFIDPEFFHKITRYKMWIEFMKYWWKNINVLFGSGGGTFIFYGPLVQHIIDFKDNVIWIFAHSDLVEVVFEFGIIGAILALWVYFDCLIKSYKQRRYWLSSAIVAFGVVLLGNYPTQMATTAFLGFYLGWEALFNDTDHEPVLVNGFLNILEDGDGES